jgi:hypothetical protein
MKSVNAKKKKIKALFQEGFIFISSNQNCLEDVNFWYP